MVWLQPEDDRQSEKLSMDNFLGLFVVLVVGCVLGVVVSCVDLAWVAARRPRDPSLPFTQRFWAELRFIFRFEQSVKPVQVLSLLNGMYRPICGE